MPVQGALQLPAHGGNDSRAFVESLLTSPVDPAVPCAVGVANPRFPFWEVRLALRFVALRRCHLAKPSLPAIIGDGSTHLGRHAHGRMANYTRWV